MAVNRLTSTAAALALAVLALVISIYLSPAIAAGQAPPPTGAVLVGSHVVAESLPVQSLSGGTVVSGDGRIALVLSQTSVVTLINRSGPDVVALEVETPEWLTQPRALGISDNGEYGVIASVSRARVINFTSGAFDDVDVAGGITSVAISNSGELFVTSQLQLLSVDVPTGSFELLHAIEPAPFTRLPWRLTNVNTSADGQVVAFNRAEENHRSFPNYYTFIVDTATKQVTDLGLSSRVALSADGSTVAFRRQTDLVLTDVASGQEQSRLAFDGYDKNGRVDLSADGSVVAFSTRLPISTFDSSESGDVGRGLSVRSQDAYIWTPATGEVVWASASATMASSPYRTIGDVHLVGQSSQQLLYVGPTHDVADSSSSFETGLLRSDLLDQAGHLRCNGQDVTVAVILGQQGTPDDDVIIGTPAADEINGNGGNDIVCAGPGDDVVVTGDGNDLIFDGRGYDTVDTYGGDDIIVGSELRQGGRADFLDAFRTGDGDDRVSGIADIDAGPGNDRIDTLEYDSFHSGRVLIVHGGEGNDQIEIVGKYIVHGGAGNDEIQHGHQIFGGDGQDNIIAADYTELADGGDGHDRITGGITARGGAGNDTINDTGHAYGGSGDDQISTATQAHGGPGDDFISGVPKAFGGPGDDFITGTLGPDELRGGPGNDRLSAREGHDLVLGGIGDDYLNGEEGDDQLRGGRGDDRLVGRWGADTILGGRGDDTAWGGQDNDRLVGGPGRDTLFGVSGNDTLFGNEGADHLDGGSGLDRFAGGKGRDTCRTEPGERTSSCRRGS